MKIQSVRTARLLSKIVLGLGVVFLCILGYAYLRVRPTNVTFSDITSTSVTVSWVTQRKSDGLAMVTGSNFILPVSLRGMGQNISYDSRDVKFAELEATEKTRENLSENANWTIKVKDFVTDLGFIKSNKYYVHHVTLTDLEPDSEYKVMIGDGLVFVNARYSDDSNTLKTLSVPDEIVAPIPAYGTIKNADNKDVPVEELQAVADGVVYFNYIDEATGERSNIFSSALNEEGNWYVDLSSAVNKEGESFLDKYVSTPTNILGELTVEAGPLGTWKKVVNIQESAPVQMIVLNTPNSIEDPASTESLIKLNSMSSGIVKGVSAADYGVFAGFCGPCGKMVDGKWVDAECNPATLAARDCSSEGSKVSFQEQINKNAQSNSGCAGRGGLGDYTLFGNDCKVCSNEGKTYARWVGGQDMKHCKGATDGTVFKDKEVEAAKRECIAKGWTWNGTSCVNPKETWQDLCTRTGGLPTSATCKCNIDEPSKRWDRIKGCYDPTSDSAKNKGSSCSLSTGKVGVYNESKVCVEIGAKCYPVGGGVGEYNSSGNCILAAAEVCKSKAVGSDCSLNTVAGTCKKLSSSGTLVCIALGVGVGCEKGETYSSEVKKCVKIGAQCSNNGRYDEFGNCTRTYSLDVCQGKSDGASCQIDSKPGKCKPAISQTIPISIPSATSQLLYCDTGDSGQDCGANKVLNQFNLCVEIGSSCGDGKKYNANGQCKDTVLDKSCWEKMIFGSLYYQDKYGDTYICEGNTFKRTSKNLTCEVGGKCNNLFSLCVNSSGQTLNCIYKEPDYRWSVEEKYASSMAIGVTLIEPGDYCNPQDGSNCFCMKSIENRFVESGNWCPETRLCTRTVGYGVPSNVANETVCDTNGNVCQDGACVPSEAEQSKLPDKGNIVNNLTGEVLAADTVSESKYIIDPSTGMVAGLVEGSYVFQHNNQTYVFSVSKEDLKNSKGKILVYIDTNTNGKYDEGTDTKISDLASEINIVSLQQKYDYSLKQGFNFVSFPFLISNSESRTAASLLKTLNEVYGDALYSISKFNGNWKVVGQNAVLYDNNDFQLLPGQGYVIKASRNVDISIVGQPVQLESDTDNAPILFNAGWNLVGLYGSNVKSYTAESLIDGINNYEEIDFTTDNVSKWDSSVQKYEGLQKEFENGVPMVYGFDFPIELQKAYFIKIKSGTGNWNPEIGQ